MGLDYSIELYFRIEDLEKALTETIKIASFDQERPFLDLVLPNGRVFRVPFSQFMKTDRIEISPDESGHLCTSLLFPANPEILDYEGTNIVIIEDQTYVPIGCLYLSIRYGRRYTKFSFMAASTRMSKLMFSSRTVHKRFLDLLTSANGVLALMDIEEDVQRVLSNLNRSVALRYKPILPGHPDKQLDYIDRFVEAALRVKANLK